MAADSPTDRLRENAVSVTSMLVISAGLLSLFTGVGPFWLIFLLGFFVLVPLVALLFGDEKERAAWWDDWLGDESDWEEWWDWSGSKETEPRKEHGSADREPSNRDALETLRHRYARGDLTDEQFERKLERLLETDSLENVEDRQRAKERLYERS
jgi:hypothetical protein